MSTHLHICYNSAKQFSLLLFHCCLFPADRDPWPSKLQSFTIQPFAEKVCWPLYSNNNTELPINTLNTYSMYLQIKYNFII